MHEQKTTLRVDGMTCASCETTIESAFKEIPGVRSADADAKRACVRVALIGNLEETVRRVNEKIAESGYRIKTTADTATSAQKPKWREILILLILAWIAGMLLNRLGFFKQGFTAGAGTGFAASFVIGLVAAASQCVAVVGGLLISLAAKFRQQHPEARNIRLAKPFIFFGAGRVLAYGAGGALIGLLGKAFAPSPLLTGLITLAAAIFMIAVGLNILGIAPRFLAHLQWRSPKAWMRKIHASAKTSDSRWTPFIIGSATFFIPCGFTQSLQLYALASGNATAGALALSGFALGTLPVLGGLWYASNSLKGKMGQRLFRFAGAAVLLLGLGNIQNGLTIIGIRSPFPAKTAVASNPSVFYDGAKQIMQMQIGGAGYAPREFTVRAGIPVRWEIEGNPGGCLSVLQAPKFKIQTRLLPNQTNIIAFTPQEPGDAVFSCSMGMFRGVIHVVPNM